MGFCGCSLYASTVSAGVYGIIFSIYGISWTSVVINNINKWQPLDSLLDIYDTYSLFSTVNFIYLKFDKVIYGMVIFSLLLHLAWIFSSIAVLIGNERKITSTLKVWVGIVSTVLITDFAFSIYAIMKPTNTCGVFQFDYTSGYAGRCYAYLLVAILFEKFGLITIGVQIALAVYVSKRVEEINRELQRPTQTMVCSPASQYAMPSGSVVIMEPYATGAQQGPNYQPSQYVGAQDWNELHPPYTRHGMHRTDDLPQK